MYNTDDREDLAELLKQGTIVQHFKRTSGLSYSEDKSYLYRVVCTAYHTETCEKMVVYKALYGECKCYVRPYSDFISMVDKIKYPSARQKYRFEVYREVTE